MCRLRKESMWLECVTRARNLQNSMKSGTSLVDAMRYTQTDSNTGLSLAEVQLRTFLGLVYIHDLDLAAKLTEHIRITSVRTEVHLPTCLAIEECISRTGSAWITHTSVFTTMVGLGVVSTESLKMCIRNAVNLTDSSTFRSLLRTFYLTSQPMSSANFGFLLSLVDEILMMSRDDMLCTAIEVCPELIKTPTAEASVHRLLQTSSGNPPLPLTSLIGLYSGMMAPHTTALALHAVARAVHVPKRNLAYDLTEIRYAVPANTPEVPLLQCSSAKQILSAINAIGTADFGLNVAHYIAAVSRLDEDIVVYPSPFSALYASTRKKSRAGNTSKPASNASTPTAASTLHQQQTSRIIPIHHPNKTVELPADLIVPSSTKGSPQALVDSNPIGAALLRLCGGNVRAMRHLLLGTAGASTTSVFSVLLAPQWASHVHAPISAIYKTTYPAAVNHMTATRQTSPFTASSPVDGSPLSTGSNSPVFPTPSATYCPDISLWIPSNAPALPTPRALLAWVNMARYGALLSVNDLLYGVRIPIHFTSNNPGAVRTPNITADFVSNMTIPQYLQRAVNDCRDGAAELMRMWSSEVGWGTIDTRFTATTANHSLPGVLVAAAETTIFSSPTLDAPPAYDDAPCAPPACSLPAPHVTTPPHLFDAVVGELSALNREIIESPNAPEWFPPREDTLLDPLSVAEAGLATPLTSSVGLYEQPPVSFNASPLQLTSPLFSHNNFPASQGNAAYNAVPPFTTGAPADPHHPQQQQPPQAYYSVPVYQQVPAPYDQDFPATSPVAPPFSNNTQQSNPAFGGVFSNPSAGLVMPPTGPKHVATGSALSTTTVATTLHIQQQPMVQQSYNISNNTVGSQAMVPVHPHRQVNMDLENVLGAYAAQMPPNFFPQIFDGKFRTVLYMLATARSTGTPVNTHDLRVVLFTGSYTWCDSEAGRASSTTLTTSCSPSGVTYADEALFLRRIKLSSPEWAALEVDDAVRGRSFSSVEEAEALILPAPDVLPRPRVGVALSNRRADMQTIDDYLLAMDVSLGGIPLPIALALSGFDSALTAMADTISNADMVSSPNSVSVTSCTQKALRHVFARYTINFAHTLLNQQPIQPPHAPPLAALTRPAVLSLSLADILLMIGAVLKNVSVATARGLACTSLVSKWAPLFRTVVSGGLTYGALEQAGFPTDGRGSGSTQSSIAAASLVVQPSQVSHGLLKEWFKAVETGVSLNSTVSETESSMANRTLLSKLVAVPKIPSSAVTATVDTILTTAGSSTRLSHIAALSSYFRSISKCGNDASILQRATFEPVVRDAILSLAASYKSNPTVTSTMAEVSTFFFTSGFIPTKPGAPLFHHVVGMWGRVLKAAIISQCKFYDEGVAAATMYASNPAYKSGFVKQICLEPELMRLPMIPINDEAVHTVLGAMLDPLMVFANEAPAVFARAIMVRDNNGRNLALLLSAIVEGIRRACSSYNHPVTGEPLLAKLPLFARLVAIFDWFTSVTTSNDDAYTLPQATNLPASSFYRYSPQNAPPPPFNFGAQTSSTGSPSGHHGPASKKSRKSAHSRA